MARRGSTNTVGWPKLALNRLSVANASSAASSSTIQDVHEEVELHGADADRPRDAKVEHRLRCQPSRAPRLELHSLIALRQDNLRRRGPGFPAEPLPVGCDLQPGARDVDAAHHPQHVRAIVREQPAGVREIVRIAPEGDGLRRCNSAGLRSGGSRAAGRLKS